MDAPYLAVRPTEASLAPVSYTHLDVYKRQLTGYAGGLDRKRALLALEEPDAAEAGRLF